MSAQFTRPKKPKHPGKKPLKPKMREFKVNKAIIADFAEIENSINHSKSKIREISTNPDHRLGAPKAILSIMWIAPILLFFGVGVTTNFDVTHFPLFGVWFLIVGLITYGNVRTGRRLKPDSAKELETHNKGLEESNRSIDDAKFDGVRKYNDAIENHETECDLFHEKERIFEKNMHQYELALQE